MNSYQRRNNFSEELSTATGSTEFSYGILNLATRKVVQQHTIEIKGLLRRTAQDIVDIGEKLSEVKQELGHGQFLAWLRTEFDWSESAARKFMQVHKKFKTVNFTHLNIATSAMYLLAADCTSKAARDEAVQRAEAGEVITRAKAKEIVQLHEQSINNLTLNIETENSSTSRVNLNQESVEEIAAPPSDAHRYQELSAQLNLLNESQIAALWAALSKRLSPNLLKRLVIETQQKLLER
jgi:hypothetical protein